MCLRFRFLLAIDSIRRALPAAGPKCQFVAFCLRSPVLERCSRPAAGRLHVARNPDGRRRWLQLLRHHRDSPVEQLAQDIFNQRRCAQRVERRRVGQDARCVEIRQNPSLCEHCEWVASGQIRGHHQPAGLDRGRRRHVFDHLYIIQLGLGVVAAAEHAGHDRPGGACKNNAGVDIANTACVMFNSRGVPIDSTGTVAARIRGLRDRRHRGVRRHGVGDRHGADMADTAPTATPTWALPMTARLARGFGGSATRTARR